MISKKDPNQLARPGRTDGDETVGDVGDVTVGDVMVLHLRGLRGLYVFLLLVDLFLFSPGWVRGEPGQLLGYLPFATIAPQDIAYDDDDGTYWITALLDNKIYHYTAGLRQEIPGDRLDSPFGANAYPTGIAFNSIDHTLLVTDIISGKIEELDRKGNPTGREIASNFKPVVNPNASPAPRGMAFDRTGDSGRGSIYVVESLGTLIYELDLQGNVIRSFNHPDDPDGFPGKGQTAPASDIDVIYEGGQLAGFYITGGRGRVSKIRRLDKSGEYTGISVSIEEAGGNVSGILRRPFERPDTGEKGDSFVCVVESNARFAVLEGGEPTFREVFDFECASSGRDVDLTWRSRENYDRIEISDGCNVLETLPGSSVHASHLFPTDGVYQLTLQAFLGDQVTSPPPCKITIGPGEILQAADVNGGVPVDITSNGATDGGGLLLVTDTADRKILLFDYDFNPVGSIEISESFLPKGDLVTGIAFSKATGNVFLFNAKTSMVGVLDEVGAFLSSFPAQLPNLEKDPQKDPDLGVVIGMTFDPEGHGGLGSLWVVEAVRDWIYEMDLEGNVLHGFPHPYLAVEPPPPGTPFGISSSGISRVAGSHDELYLGGGALRDLRQPHILRIKKSTGALVPGYVIPTDGIRKASTNDLFTVESIVKNGEPRLVVLTLAGKSAQLLAVRTELPPVVTPTFLKAREVGYSSDVLLEFTNNGPYDRMEVFRDCTKVAALPGDAARHVDRDVSVGFHEYAVRGVRGGVSSDFARAAVQVGPGAVLERAFVWPARSPQQLTRDPVDGSFFVAVNWPGDERKAYHFDKNFVYLGARESIVEPPWEIAALAVRAPAGEERELSYLTWQLPVPIGDVGSQQFFLVREGYSGGDRGKVEVFPPRPTNGFITFPTGLVWADESDTFFYLERNSKTFVQMTAGGETMRTFPNPASPFQNFVFNLGVSLVPERGTLFITGSEKLDHRVTEAFEMTFNGSLTGVTIPFGNLDSTITGISIRGDDLVAVGTGAFAEMFRLKAFSEASKSFIRGDADGNGAVNLSDAIVTLIHLFRGGPSPQCEDAADADDNGDINLTDAVATLLLLFGGSGPLPPPYPAAGADPTPDGLACF